MDLTSLFGAQAAPTFDGANGSTFGDSARLSATGVTGTTGGPAAAAGGAGGATSILSGLFSGLADAYKGYAQGSAMKNQQAVPGIPQGYQPITTQFPFTMLPQEPQITRG